MPDAVNQIRWSQREMTSLLKPLKDFGGRSFQLSPKMCISIFSEARGFSDPPKPSPPQLNMSGFFLTEFWWCLMIFGVILPHRPFADTRCAVRSDNCSFHVLENNPECLKIESQISEISVGGARFSVGGGARDLITFGNQWSVFSVNSWMGGESFARIATRTVTTEQSELQNTRNRCKNVGQNLLDDLSYITNQGNRRTGTDLVRPSGRTVFESDFGDGPGPDRTVFWRDGSGSGGDGPGSGRPTERPQGAIFFQNTPK